MDDRDINDTNESARGTLTRQFGGGTMGESSLPEDPNALFGPNDYSIYINKVTLEAYIFHAPKIVKEIDHLEYQHKECRLAFHMKDGSVKDLGAKIEWMMRPYFKKMKEIGIVQTKDGKEVDGFHVPVVQVSESVQSAEGA